MFPDKLLGKSIDEWLRFREVLEIHEIETPEQLDCWLQVIEQSEMKIFILSAKQLGGVEKMGV